MHIHGKQRFISYYILVLLIFGTIHLEMLAYSAILDRFNWCGTLGLYRKSVADIYLILFVPVAMITLFLKRKKTLLADSFVRIACLAFLSAMILYWFFEDHCPSQWFASNWHQ